MDKAARDKAARGNGMGQECREVLISLLTAVEFPLTYRARVVYGRVESRKLTPECWGNKRRRVVH